MRLQRSRNILTSRTLFIVCIVLAAGGLGLAFALAGAWQATLAALAIGLAWALPELAQENKRWASLGGDWFSNLWFVLLALGAVWVSLSGRPWQLALGIIATALAAWDLRAFRKRVFATHDEQTRLRAYHRARAGVGLINKAKPPPPGGEEVDLAGGAKTAPGAALMPDAENGLNASTQAESAAFEVAHLRALGWVWLASVLGTAGLYELARVLQFPAELGPALAISLALVLGMILLARLLARP